MNVMAMGIDELRIAVQTLRPLAAEAQRLQHKVDRLQAIVDKLPKTADAVCIAAAQNPHELCLDGTIVRVTEWYLYSDGIWGVRTWNDKPLDGFVTHVVADDNRVYSTREAAEATRKETGG